MVASEFEKKAVADVERLRSRLMMYQAANWEKQRYYDAKSRIKDLGISLPPALRSIESVMGWTGTVEKALEERRVF